MNPKDKELYQTLFKDMTPVEYLKISKIARWKKFTAGDVMIRQEHMVTDLILIYNGTVDVMVRDKKVAELRDGQFVGEMSFLTEKSATATCVAKHDTECLVWKQPEFKDLLKRNPSLYYTIQSLLSNQLISYSNK
jgi:signal-transduction protein with cAMP-binding, CBS, and nucleotidyltransferase domain